MRSVVLAFPADWAGWRQAARALAGAMVPPETIVWSVGEAADLFAEAADLPPEATFAVPRAFVEVAETAIMARDEARFALLYRILFRIRAGEKQLMADAADKDVFRAQLLAKAVRRDIHKMRAFLRFRDVDGGALHVAWFEPAHHIVEANAPFFVRRFATMRWSILTPERSAHWDGEVLRLGPGARPEDVPDDDRLEAYWRTYFAAIFNPARLKVSAMLSEMPKKYWKNLPEARAIPELIETAGLRTARMLAEAPSVPRVAKAPPAPCLPPAGSQFEALAREAASCRACPLWEHATQTVFGDGPDAAPLVLVGEQPGDQEDLAGLPFVGPAGQVLSAALLEAGLERDTLYITNAVKHFKFTPRGKRRIHEKPNEAEIESCRFWLVRELDLLRPRLIVALGATAARSLLRRNVTISRARGAPVASALGPVLVTVHPSYLLRIPDEEAKAREFSAFVEDLRKAREAVLF